MRQTWTTYATVIALLLAPMQAAFAGTLYPKVVVTVPAITPLVNILLTGITHADDLIRPGQDAHEFALSSRQRQMLDQADVIILAESSMTPQLATLLATERKRGAAIVELSALNGASPLPYADENPWIAKAREQAKSTMETKKSSQTSHHEEEDDEAEATTDSSGKKLTDPHLWLDPLRMANLAIPLAEAIATKAPQHRAQLLANAATLDDHLRNTVSPAIAERLQSVAHNTSAMQEGKPVIPFITYHDAYQYFMTRFQLNASGEITQRPEAYLGAGLLHDVIASAQKTRIHCIISETDSPLVKRIAAASGARIVLLSPEVPVTEKEISSAAWATNDYDRLLQKTVDNFAACLMSAPRLYSIFELLRFENTIKITAESSDFAPRSERT